MTISLPNIYVAIVEDDDSLRRSLSRLLHASGIQSVTYPSAEAFLADTKHPQFDCLVLDIQLSGMSGIELSQRLAALGSTTPVIFNTVFDEPDIHDQAMRAGCAAYLRKTDSGDTVLTAIARAIRPGLRKRAE